MARSFYESLDDLRPTEPAVNTPIYCSGIHRAVVIDGEIHLVWYIDQPGIEGIERVANLRTIMRVEAIPDARKLVDSALKAAGAPRALDS